MAEFNLEVDTDGRPRAVFREVDPTHNELLSGFLNPAPHFVSDILYEISLVERNALEISGFETADVRVIINRNLIIIEPFETVDQQQLKITLPLTKAKLLLFEWGVALQRLDLGLTNHSE